jgi:hypothetical protein
MWETLQHWFFSLGPKYGVNPIIFGSIYVGAIPLFMLSIGWLIRNLRQKKSVVFPVLCASCCFVSAYVYLIVAGKNIPVWVYLFLLAMLVYGIFSTVKKVRQGVRTPTP